MADPDQQELCRGLLKRFGELEASHRKLREQFDLILREREDEEERKVAAREGCFPGFFFKNCPYYKVLHCMGHAVYICRPPSWEIIYWNQSAENLYGWKSGEVLGRRDFDLLINEKDYVFAKTIIKSLNAGHSWSGQFPLKKRSGEMFMAMVTKSPLYEDGEFVGVITVSSDAAVFNDVNLQKLRSHQDHAHDQPRERMLNMERFQWQPRSHIPSSVYNLASKVLSFRDGDAEKTVSDDTNSRRDTIQAAELEKPNEKEIPICGHADAVAGQSLENAVARSLRTTKNRCDLGFMKVGASPDKNSLHTFRGGYSNGRERENLHAFGEASSAINKKLVYHCDECNSCCGMPASGLDQDKKKATEISLENQNGSLTTQTIAQQNLETKQSPTGRSPSNSSREENELSSLVDTGILWEDLLLGEEIGQGSCAVVYRGIWNGSDVAIKVYLGNEYHEEIFVGYRKEIAIMKRLRHPNVLLFMGAVCSPERLAIVTEFLPRGSLFKALHKNNQSLDLRRRLRMALDVAKGMNYLHCRNPPIIHRDLKSSNLLVDKNWTVKVGDFGLSGLKNSTFLTAKSVKGTPQWTAPEVLRNEPSNEKSDVFSFGVVLWELMTESIPWANLNSLQVLGVVGFMDRRLDVPEDLDPRIASIIHDCWRSDPEQRPSFEQIRQRMADLINSVVAAPGGKKREDRV